ncbi:MAG: DUF4145 domain-containing protein, partial [Polyangiales bacterium]
MGAPSASNFAFLAAHDRSLVLFGEAAERAFHQDPIASVMHLRRLGEALAQAAAANAGIFSDAREDQLDRLRRLRDAGVLNREVADLFHAVRKAGNAAVHDGVANPGSALHLLKLGRSLAVWFHQSFGDRNWKPGAFVPPRPPEDASAALRTQLDELRARLAASEAASEAERQAADDARREALSAAERAKEDKAERAALEAILDEAAEREAAMVERLKTLASAANAAPAQ